MQLGPLRVEPALRRLVHEARGEEILEPRIMQVLVALARSPGRILTRDDLVQRCWGGLIVGEDSITRVMGRLRRLSRDIAQGVFEIETITKVGYRLLLSPAAAQAEPATAPPVLRPRDASRPSVCVFPFVNMSADPEQAYFSEGISEDIITDLTKISALSVVSKNVAFTFSGGPDEIRRAAQERGVTHVLEGSVRKAREQVRISAQLIQADSGVQIWGDRWDGDLTDIFGLQDQITHAIVAALKLRLLPSEQKAIERRGTSSPEAYDLYLMARRQRAGGNAGDPRREEAVLRLARQAIEIDPDYAAAWALVAICQRLLHSRHRQGGDDGFAAAERALALDPRLADAHAVKARHLLDQGDLAAAAAALEAALALDPESWEANQQAALLAFREGRHDTAIRHYRKCCDLAEGDFASAMSMVNCHQALHDQRGARQAARLACDRATAAAADDPSNGSAMSTCCLALAALGDRAGAREWARRAMLINPRNMIMRYNIACALSAYLHDAEGAIQILEPLIELADRFELGHMSLDPELDPIRNHPRFQAVMAAREAALLRAEAQDHAPAAAAEDAVEPNSV